MAFRIQLSDDALLVEGLVDDAAIVALKEQLSRRGRVVLRRGTEVEPECIAELHGLGVELVAESAFLARMLRAPQP